MQSVYIPLCPHPNHPDSESKEKTHCLTKYLLIAFTNKNSTKVSKCLINYLKIPEFVLENAKQRQEYS